MKKFNELTKNQQEQAKQHFFNMFLTAAAEGSLIVDDELQARVDKQLNKAESMCTPWFAYEYLLDDPVIRENIAKLAQCEAETAVYNTENLKIVTLKE